MCSQQMLWRSQDGLDVEALLLLPFEMIEIQLQRACNELVPAEAPAPEYILLEARRIWSGLWGAHEAEEIKELVHAWSLLLSQVQAEALDRAELPHPAILLPVTDEQRDFWYNFAAAVEFLPESELEEQVIAAISQEWTAVATIGEALRAFSSLQVSCLQSAAPKTSILVYVLGPSPSLEYREGLEDLHHKLVACLCGLESHEASNPCLRLIFYGLEVPNAIDGHDWAAGKLRVEHRHGCWHEERDRLQPDLIIAMNAGTSVGEYRDLWLPTLKEMAKLEHCLLWFTGYSLPEASDTWKDLQQSCPRADCLYCGAGRSSTLAGFDRLELGVTPCSFPGKANYALCTAWLRGALLRFCFIVE